MASFDIVSETDIQEVDNAINSVSREIGQRYDFKGSNCSVDRDENTITVNADDDYKLGAIEDMLKVHLTRRKIDSKALGFNKPEQASGNSLRQSIDIKQGIDSDTAKKIVKAIKQEKFKVQASIRGEEVRVDGKKRDDLQQVIQFVKEMNIDLPLNFTNFRD